MKKISFIYCIITLVFTAIGGCGMRSNYTSVDKNEEGVIVFDLTEALENESVPVDDIIDSIKIIPLEASGESLLSYVHGIHVSSKNIYIRDFLTGVNIFDQKGKFIKKIGKGTGPNEIATPGAMSYDENNNFLYIYDSGGDKLMKFNSDGDFLSYFQFGGTNTIRDIDILDNIMLVAQVVPGNYFTIATGDTIGNIFDTFLFDYYQYPFVFRKFVMRYDGGFNIKAMLDNNIYYFKDNTIMAKYKLKYPMASLDYSKYERMRDMEQAIPNGKYIFEGDYMESKDYLYTNLVGGAHKERLFVKILFTNKKNSKSVCITAKQCSVTMFMTIEDVYTDSDNWFVGLIRPEKLVSTAIPEEYRWDGSNPNNLISDEDMAKLKAVKPDDNPIIVLFKLKDDI